MSNNLENSQCVISYRLLKLLQWLAEREQEELKKLIAHSLKSGLCLESEKRGRSNVALEEELQQSVISYFSLLEVLIGEVLEESENRNDLQRKLIPALDRIDVNFCDVATVSSSVERLISNPSTANSQEGAKQIVFKELLKRWKPEKKSLIN